MKTKMKMIFAALSLALLMVFSFNALSQGNKPQQDDKGKRTGCMAMMQDEAKMKDCMAMMGKNMEQCMGMMESKEMKEMCAKMMASMNANSSMCKMHKDGKMGESKMKAAEPQSQAL